MRWTNTEDRYGMVAILFHWVMAFLMIVLLIIGLYMTRIPISRLKLKLFGWHKELGVLVLMLVVLRLIWRRINEGRPFLPLYLPQWQIIASRIVHWGFYFLMVALPISGWLISSAAGLPASFFGWFVLPDFIAPDELKRLFFSNIHTWLAYALIFALLLHSSAALKHHFWDKNDILRRIL